MLGSTADLKYSVTINSGLIFNQAALDVNAAGISPAFSVTKNIYSDPNFSTSIGSINHTDNNSPAPVSIYGYSTIYVDDSLSYSAGNLSSVVNTFSQVPEPSTLALAGLGGIGLVVSAARRRRATAV